MLLCGGGLRRFAAGERSAPGIHPVPHLSHPHTITLYYVIRMMKCIACPTPLASLKSPYSLWLFQWARLALITCNFGDEPKAVKDSKRLYALESSLKWCLQTAWTTQFCKYWDKIVIILAFFQLATEEYFGRLMQVLIWFFEEYISKVGIAHSPHFTTFECSKKREGSRSKRESNKLTTSRPGPKSWSVFYPHRFSQERNCALKLRRKILASQLSSVPWALLAESGWNLNRSSVLNVCCKKIPPPLAPRRKNAIFPNCKQMNMSWPHPPEFSG